MSHDRIVLLPGDGIGPEIIAVARRVLEHIGAQFGRVFAFETHLIGGAAIDATGDALPDTSLQACQAAHAVLLGAVGGPKWDQALRRPEDGLLAIRKQLGLFANIRPLRILDCLVEHSPLRPELARGVDIVLFRELTSGAYFGEKSLAPDRASDLCVYQADEIARIARAAFRAAQQRRGRLASIDKANVMATGKLWRRIVSEVHRAEFPDIALEHVLVDAMAMHIVRDPRRFDVLVTENMFGDILSDELSALAGSIGLAPSASLGEGTLGLYEPVHGSAPDIAGQDRANPIGAVLSAAMLLRQSLRLEAEAQAIEAAVERALAKGARTSDLGGTLGCAAMGAAIIEELVSGG